MKPENDNVNIKQATTADSQENKNFTSQNTDKLLGSLSEEQVLKLAEILAVMQKIGETQTDKILTKPELQTTSENIKRTLPEPPKNIILKVVRSKEEKKIAKQKTKIDKLKVKLGKQKGKQRKIRNKISKQKFRQQECLKQIEYLKHSVSLIICKKALTRMKLNLQKYRINRTFGVQKSIKPIPK
jgi:septal ring factor EnvC (AmiA/AmiB activator)